MVNKCVFNCLLKDSMVEVVLVLAGRLFQAACPAALKARSPKVVFGVRLGMLSNPTKIDADHEIIAIDILNSLHLLEL